jgi:hypothetical protein
MTSPSSAHRRHFGQHLGAELGLRAVKLPLATGRTGPRPRRGQIGGLRGGVAVVGAGGAMLREKGAALAVRGKIALPAQAILAGDFGKRFRLSRKPSNSGSTTGSGR